MKNVLKYLERFASERPDHKAISLADEGYTFAELKEVSSRLGARIKECGIKGRPIGVLADRNANTIMYFMAVLYSGNYYVPIDPDMPDNKKQAIIDDADLKIILGDEALEEKIERISFSGDYLSVKDCADTACDMPENTEDLDPLYMVYTSGSTGKPKGVLKSHGAQISFIEHYRHTFGFTGDEIIGNQTPFFFDASAKDIYLMLCTGASMEIIPTQKFALPPELIDYMNVKKISFASWVPTAISIVAQLNPFSMMKPEYLKRLFFVGEVMPMKHLNKWRKALPDIQYVNLYGSSEMAGICCYYEVKDKFEDNQILPIGKPLEGAHVYLLDERGVITEPDKVGEIYLVSDTLALEYYHDPEKTAAAFMIKDFGNGPQRCYRTGDLASFDREGNLIFAARTDSQIKHMGHRIELGEIEAIAGALPEIDRCCCLYNGEKRRIVLFCELQKDCESTGVQIKSLLKKHLSAYMVPGKVIVMDHLPLNANGKINRQELREKI